MPEMEQSKKMVNQESFIRNRIAKAVEQLKKLHKDNREKEITHLMYTCLTGKGLCGLAVPELNNVGWLIDRDLKEIYMRIKGLKEGVPALAPPSKEEEKAADLGGGFKRGAQQQSWFRDSTACNIPIEPHQQGQLGGRAFGGHAGGEVGEEMIIQFNDGNNHNNNVINNHGVAAAAIWSSAFFSLRF